MQLTGVDANLQIMHSLRLPCFTIIQQARIMIWKSTKYCLQLMFASLDKHSLYWQLCNNSICLDARPIKDVQHWLYDTFCGQAATFREWNNSRSTKIMQILFDCVGAHNRLPKRFAKNTKEQKKGHPHSPEEEDQRLPAHFPNQAFGKHDLQFKTELCGKLALQWKHQKRFYLAKLQKSHTAKRGKPGFMVHQSCERLFLRLNGWKSLNIYENWELQKGSQRCQAWSRKLLPGMQPGNCHYRKDPFKRCHYPQVDIFTHLHITATKSVDDALQGVVGKTTSEMPNKAVKCMSGCVVHQKHIQLQPRSSENEYSRFCKPP